MARSRVTVSNGFPRHKQQLHADVKRGLAQGGKIIAREIEAVPTNYRIEQIKRSVALPVERTRRGFSVAVTAPDFRAIFFEKGTRGKKGAGKRKSTKAVEGGRGVKPQRFMKKGLKAAEPKVADAIARALR